MLRRIRNPSAIYKNITLTNFEGETGTVTSAGGIYRTTVTLVRFTKKFTLTDFRVLIETNSNYSLELVTDFSGDTIIETLYPSTALVAGSNELITNRHTFLPFESHYICLRSTDNTIRKRNSALLVKSIISYGIMVETYWNNALFQLCNLELKGIYDYRSWGN